MGGGRGGSCTRGTEGARGPRREVPGCAAPRRLSVNCLWGAVTFLPFTVFISLFTKTLPQNPSSLSSWGSPPQVSGAAVEKQVSPGMSAELGQLFLWWDINPMGCFLVRGRGKLLLWKP